MDPDVKDILLERFRCYLDSIEAPPEPDQPPGNEADLFTVFVELAAMRTEVRTESRLVKDALEQFRGVFDTLQTSHATLEQELKRAQADARERGRILLRPLLLDLLDLRDRLVAALQAAAGPPARRFGRWRRPRTAPPESWREGVAITLRRLDQILFDRHVTPIEVVGRQFDPRVGRVLSTTSLTAMPAGVVVDEVRTGFMWETELLRSAEVIVNKTDAGQGETAS